MQTVPVSSIESWHAHIYFDTASRDAAWAFRLAVEQRFGARVRIGRFHERLVGPHPSWSSQIAFDAKHFADVVPWLVLNHGALDLFVHPNTGDELRDHRDSAMWIGRSYALNLDALTKT